MGQYQNVPGPSQDEFNAQTQAIANLDEHSVTIERFSTYGADGSIRLLKSTYYVLAANEDGYVLVPYTRSDTTDWAIRVAGGTAYSGSCYVAYIKR